MNTGRVKSCLARFKNVNLNKEENWNSSLWNKPIMPTCYEVPKNYYGIDVNPFEIFLLKT